MKNETQKSVVKFRKHNKTKCGIKSYGNYSDREPQKYEDKEWKLESVTLAKLKELGI
jgi:hypothetical protein